MVCCYVLLPNEVLTSVPASRQYRTATAEIPLKHVHSECSTGDLINLLLERLASGVHNGFNVEFIEKSATFVFGKISGKLHFVILSILNLIMQGQALNPWLIEIGMLPELWDIIWDYKCGFEDWELYCMYSRMVCRRFAPIRLYS